MRPSERLGPHSRCPPLQIAWNNHSSLGLTFLMTVALIVVVLVLGFANGANDNFKPMATVYGSRTLSYRQSITLATVAQIIGSLASVVLAAGLVKAFGGKGLVPDETVASPAFLMAVGSGAAVAVLVATRIGMPISTTHGLLGGLAGAGLAIAPTDLAWSALGSRFALPLLVSPLLAVGATVLIYPILRGTRRRMGIGSETCLCVGEVATASDAVPSGGACQVQCAATVTIGDSAACREQYVGAVAGINAQRVVDGLHISSGFTLGVARGLNDTPKVLALLVAASWSGIPIQMSLAIIAVAMAAGGLLQARRVANTLSRRITEMNTGQGLLANVVASSLVIGASFASLPVSTTHVSTSAIFGIGAWNRRTDWSVVGEILMAWLFTLPVAAAVAWVGASALQ